MYLYQQDGEWGGGEKGRQWGFGWASNRTCRIEYVLNESSI